MIGREAIEQILEQYARHGWRLRRVLLRPGSPAPDGLFDAAEIIESEIEGLWFSRASRPGITAWELRHLSQTPYALVANIPDDTDDQSAETLRKSLETKMAEAAPRPTHGH